MSDQFKKQETLQLRNKYIGNICRLYFEEDPLKIVRAKGQFMYDENGVEYLDCINNVAHVGHCHPDVVKAGCDQMSILCTNNRYLDDNLVSCARNIIETMSPSLSVCFFVNSGSEANDLALRMAKNYTETNDIITLECAYHGHVQSTIDISPLKYVSPLGPQKPDYVHVASSPDPYRGKYSNEKDPLKAGELYANEIKDICTKLEKSNRKPCAFIAEMMPSCGGQIVPPANYFTEAFKHVRKAGGLCIADEVQIGFGRMGTHWWGYQKYNVCPDIVTIGKSMGNGHPVSAVVTTEAIAQKFKLTNISYFNTFGGNNVSCAISKAVLKVIHDEKLMENALLVGNHLMERLREIMLRYKFIGDVRGCGLFIGIEIVWSRLSKEPASQIAKAIVNGMKRQHVLISRDGIYNNVLKLKPPMVFTIENANCFLKNFDCILNEISEDFAKSPYNKYSANMEKSMEFFGQNSICKKL